MRKIILINKLGEVTRNDPEEGIKGYFTTSHGYPFECKYIDAQGGYTCGGGEITPDMQSYIDKIMVEVNQQTV